MLKWGGLATHQNGSSQLAFSSMCAMNEFRILENWPKIITRYHLRDHFDRKWPRYLFYSGQIPRHQGTPRRVECAAWNPRGGVALPLPLPSRTSLPFLSVCGAGPGTGTFAQTEHSEDGQDRPGLMVLERPKICRVVSEARYGNLDGSQHFQP